MPRRARLAGVDRWRKPSRALGRESSRRGHEAGTARLGSLVALAVMVVEGREVWVARVAARVVEVQVAVMVAERAAAV